MAHERVPGEIPNTISMIRPSTSQQKAMQDCSRARGISLTADWDGLLTKNDHQTYDIEMQHTNVPSTEFLTGSAYEGGWDILGMSGFGTFTFPHGVEYEGYFRDGEFHGEGTLIYPMGQKVHGFWSSGKLMSWSYQFKDGLEFDETWHYCKYPDRRFYQSIKNGLNPAGKERLTNDPIPREIPPGCYDAGDGFYHPENKYIFSVHDHKKILRIPSQKETEWIVKNCRKAWDEPTGYNPELYPEWTTGRKTSTTKLMEEWTDVEDETISTIFNFHS